MSVHCRYHCVACGAHFASCEAFDFHRAGDHAVKRYCLAPDDVEQLTVASSAGRCHLTNPPRWVEGVVVYRSRRHADDHQGTVQRLRRSERTAGPGRGDISLAVAA